MYDFRNEYEETHNRKNKVGLGTKILTLFSVVALVVSSLSLYKVSKLVNNTTTNQVGINVVQGASNSDKVAPSTNGVVSVVDATKNNVAMILVYGETSTSRFSNNISYGVIGSGSGFVVSADGYVVTNYHVVDEGSSFKVSLGNNKQYDATLVGGDSYNDIAVLKIKSDEKFDPITLGDSDSVKVGEIAIAIGSPLGSELANSVTVGYISAVDRQMTNDGHTATYIQTDAAINPGNSGGPLINASGNVIGINTMKSTVAGYDSYGNAISTDGISFAIPINHALPIVTEIIESGSYRRPGIGISYYVIDEETAKKSNVKQGLLISQVYDNSPASDAGLKVEDIIIAVDGKETKTTESLNNYINSKKVGDKVLITVIRKNKTQDIELTLGDINKINTQEETKTTKQDSNNGWKWPF